MLVLGVTVNDLVVITCPDGTPIRLRLLSPPNARGGLRLGIDAPRDYRIDRPGHAPAARGEVPPCKS